MDCLTQSPGEWTESDAAGLVEGLVNPAVQWLNKKRVGKWFSSEDAEDIAVDALFKLGQKWDKDKGLPDQLYWKIVKDMAIDRIRKNRHRQERELEHMTAVLASGSGVVYCESPDEALLDEDRRARSVLATALYELTPRMREAVVARSSAQTGEDWAMQLASRSGGSAKGWRKASDDGIKRLANLMQASGFDPIKKGDAREPASGAA